MSSLPLPSHPSAPPSRRFPYRWELLVWLWLAFFFNQADRQVFSVVLPQVKASLGLTDVQAGWIATIFTAALGLTVPFAGYVGDRFNRAKIVTLAVLGWSAATLLTGFGTSFIYLILIRSIATGSGEAFYAPAANALIAEHHQATRARAMAVHQTSLYVGVIASGLVAGWIADQFGWRASFWVFGGAGLVLAVFLFWRLQSTAVPSPAERPSLGEALRVMLRPTVLLLTVAFGAMVFVNIGFLTWMPTYLHEAFGLNLARAGYHSMVYHHVGAFAGVMLGGVLSDRLAMKRPNARAALQGLALLLGAPFLWQLGAGHSLLALYVLLTLFGFFRGIYDAGIYASLYDVIEPRLRATVSGLVIASAYIVGAAAPVLLGAIKSNIGLASSFPLLALVYVGGGIAALAAAAVSFRLDRAKATAPVS